MRALLLLAVLLPLPTHARRAAPPVHEVIVKEGEVHQGLRFPPGTKLLVRVQGGAVTYATLSADFTISGVKLLKGTGLELDGEGRLFTFTPVAGQKLAGLTLEAGQASSVMLDRDSRPAEIHLSAPMEVQGYRFGKGAQLQLSPEGKLTSGSRAQAQEKSGLFVAEGSDLYFHPGGGLRQATLAKESRHGELRLAPDPNPASPAHVELWENGKLRAGLLAANASVQGFTCGPGRVAFFESGKLQSCVLGAPASVSLNGYPKEAKAGDTLTLAEDGRVVGWGGR